MLKRNWFYLFGGFFIVIGVLLLLTSSWVDGAWAITLGAGNLFIGYGQRHPEQFRGVWAWALAIAWGVLFAALTIQRLTTR
jgi:hypothetical protein